MGEFSLMHWLIVALIILLVFGVKRLPEMGSALGKSIREFKKSMSEITSDEERPPLSRGEDQRTPVRDDREPKRLSR